MVRIHVKVGITAKPSLAFFHYILKVAHFKSLYYEVVTCIQYEQFHKHHYSPKTAVGFAVSQSQSQEMLVKRICSDKMMTRVHFRHNMQAVQMTGYCKD